MYGEITKFRKDLGLGIIAAEDGRKYRFTRTAILNSAEPMIGQGVDFEIDTCGPTGIVMMAGSPWTAFSNLGCSGR